MKKLLFSIFVLLLSIGGLQAQTKLDTLLPVRGFCIAAPESNEIENFIKFINEELAPRQVNTIILRVDYNYEFKSHPEIRDSLALSRKDVKKLVKACQQHNIHLIPQINLFGHQSWATKTYSLLRVYPEFDETPHVKMPAKYAWPNDDGLYCKSYCPLHPEVHKVVLALVDEICDAFESKAFHAGMDEVFYIGHDKCPRCKGHDKAELFAGEVNLIRNHLAQQNRKLWIWGDRLIDGKTTGIGEWEASMNNTHRAVDLIAKDVVICDWHYERPDPTAVYFAMKGFNVITCPWRKPKIAVTQTQDMLRFKEIAPKDMKPRYFGMMQTIWSSNKSFLEEFYGIKVNEKAGENTSAQCFRAMFDEIKKVNTP